MTDRPCHKSEYLKVLRVLERQGDVLVFDLFGFVVIAYDCSTSKTVMERRTRCLIG